MWSGSIFVAVIEFGALVCLGSYSGVSWQEQCKGTLNLLVQCD